MSPSLVGFPISVDHPVCSTDKGKVSKIGAIPLGFHPRIFVCVGRSTSPAQVSLRDPSLSVDSLPYLPRCSCRNRSGSLKVRSENAHGTSIRIPSAPLIFVFFFFLLHTKGNSRCLRGREFQTFKLALGGCVF